MQDSPAEDYKTTRLKEIRDIIYTEYPDLFIHNEKLMAHLFQECPVMTWDCAYKKGQARNDHGWSVGMAQWHIYWRHNEWVKENGYYYTHSKDYVANMRSNFFEDHPEMKDWRYQVRRYLTEMRDRIKSEGSIDGAILSWNRGAGWAYVSKVSKNVFVIRDIVQ